jgi:flagellum-specific peptidoglycan hydrolase FlgJ
MTNNQKENNNEKFQIFNSEDFLIFKKEKLLLSFNKKTNKIKEEKENLFKIPSNSNKYEIYNLIGLIPAKKFDYFICVDDAELKGNFLSSSVYKIKKFLYIPFQLNSNSNSNENNSIENNSNSKETENKNEENKNENKNEENKNEENKNENKNEENKNEDLKYLKMLDDFLNRNNLYYSNNFDLTISLQEHLNHPINKNSHIFPLTISKFCWNYSMAKIFDFPKMNKFVFPIINGFFKISPTIDYNEKLFYAIIARKDVRRSGMRFLIRGSDNNGNVSNFVETEEILVYEDENNLHHLLSYNQIRGSIPLIWTQNPNLQLNPLIRPSEDYNKNKEVFNIHLKELILEYKNIILVNLIDKKKDQKKIGEIYQNLTRDFKENNKRQNNNVDFIWFDFHKECKKMKYENISKLLSSEIVSKSLETQNYFHIQFDKNKIKNFENLSDFLSHKHLLKIIKLQNGIFRTNCIDSLDRTNVVQSVFARNFLHKMLNDLNLNKNSEKLKSENSEKLKSKNNEKIKSENTENTENTENNENNSEKTNSQINVFEKFNDNFEKIFKLFWADHGDEIAFAYSGTGAMKSDFVRTGKRTLLGALEDGKLTSIRFFINNLIDGYNQDCLDYFIGALNPRKNNFKEHTLKNFQILCSIVLIISFVVFNRICRIIFDINGNNNLFKKIVKFILFLIVFCGSLFISAILGKKNILDFHTRFNNNISNNNDNN